MAIVSKLKLGVLPRKTNAARVEEKGMRPMKMVKAGKKWPNATAVTQS